MEWRQIPGFDSRYEVTAAGRVRSWMTKGKGDHRAASPHPLKGSRHHTGYPIYGLRTADGRWTSVFAQNLVAAAFLGPCPPGLVIRHVNGDPWDCRVENLVYGTMTENHADRERHGRTAKGERSGKAKATEAMVDEIIARRAKGESQMSIAKAVGLGQSAVSSILRGQTWSHYTGINSR